MRVNYSDQYWWEEKMSLVSTLKVTAASLTLLIAGCATTAMAQEAGTAAEPAAAATSTGYPLVSGDFWEVTGVDLKPGGELAYARHLADRWKASQEYGKTQGWIKDYMVLANNYPRQGEPDLYLITVSAAIPDGAEWEARNAAFEAWAERSTEQLVSENANRAEFREIMGTSLLQELNFRD